MMIMSAEKVIKRLKLLSENKGVQTLSYDEARILLAEIERLNNIIEKSEQENAVLKTQVVNKDKYSYGIRMGSDKK